MKRSRVYDNSETEDAESCKPKTKKRCQRSDSGHGSGDTSHGSLSAVWQFCWNSVRNMKNLVKNIKHAGSVPMKVKVVLQQAVNSDSFSIFVICFEDESPGICPCLGTSVVGESLTSRRIPPGRLSIRLVSKSFEGDVKHGEDSNLTKYEDNFNGRNFEKQFACKFKNNILPQKGNFGKVIINILQEGEKEVNLFELNLTLNHCNARNKVFPIGQCLQWSDFFTKGLQGLAGMNRVENVKALAKILGFTNYEIQNMESCHVDSLSVMIHGYKARGGTMKEFLQALYALERKQNMDKKEVIDKSSREQTNSNHALPRITALQTDLDINVSTEGDICQTPGTPSPLLSPIKPVHSLTPPPSTSQNHDSFNSKCIKSGQKSKNYQSKLQTKAQQVPKDIFDFELPDDHIYRECWEELNPELPNEISQLQEVQKKWKLLGRNLHIPDIEIRKIEVVCKKHLFPCSQKMFKIWKEIHPTRFKYGVLYAALCETGLKPVALKYCTLGTIGNT